MVAADAGGAAAVRPAQDDRRAGVRSDQRGARLPPLLPAGALEDQRGMVSGVSGIQLEASAYFDHGISVPTVPMMNGATGIMFEGIPTYPAADRFWSIVEKYKATIFYTAPTAIRSLMRFGEELPAKHDLSSLRLLGTVGEPINPEAWIWYRKNIGRNELPIMDTWIIRRFGGCARA